MLQIASAKFFTHAPKQRNTLRGVLHTNLCLLPGTSIQTEAGKILPINTNQNAPNQLLYELTELIEDEPSAGVIASHGIEAYVYDFAAVVSLALNVTCTVSPDEITRLIGNQHPTKLWYPPSSFIPRVFDRQVWCKDYEISSFIEFVEDLIALERRSFLAALRAIRTYVVGLHRLADDPDLSYTLFVASIESLAQGFDQFRPEWTDYDPTKRRKLDAALANADEETARRVREALLEIEHTSLARRFREFAIEHIDKSYFRDGAVDVQRPLSRPDLPEALNAAYRIRSGYIHRLRELPRPLLLSMMPGETVRIEGVSNFTFRGVARLARHVIKQFIKRQPKVCKESYDYRRERYGIVDVPLAPQYWIGESEKLKLASGTKRFEGFLDQISSCFKKDEGATITDLQPMLQEAEKLFASSNRKGRRSMLTLYFLFNALIPNERRMPNLEAVERQYGAEINAPSIETMFVHLVLRVRPDLPLAICQGLYNTYFEQRSKKRGLVVRRTLEAGIALELAERFRLDGDFDTARDFIGRAVESYPEHSPLQLLEEEFAPNITIRWFNIIFPEKAKELQEGSDSPS